MQDILSFTLSNAKKKKNSVYIINYNLKPKIVKILQVFQ